MSRTNPSGRSVMFRFFIAHSDVETISGAFIKILLTSDTGDGSPWLNVDVLLQHPCQSRKKTVSFYNAQTKSYSIDYSKLTINLHDEKFHTAYFILNNNYKGYTCFAIDGVYFNRELPTGNLLEKDLPWVPMQMEPATCDDIWKNFLNTSKRSHLAALLKNITGTFNTDNNDIPRAGTMIGDLFFAAMCRVFCLGVPIVIPNATDTMELSNYYKKYYYTDLCKDPMAN
ncbi:unnamed protein product [Commensalibacter communis]|uniref:Uncharacterized protein n=1 Tax=Commensalibacter communis TaxID=2972786 RepID=A0A9W4XCX0_9PROT|nr:hypothetical protein [Commensalibacter communis]CAI3924888.1 unnamed protein product [Commensalibacter communis]CAI3925409.1 unnamed protein product [Commensalibacter communis]CAI3935917.1 unnamed protein product [Commensalibacter communis]CAI3937559.1 unnamed protein product [Commensalibacter communis]